MATTLLFVTALNARPQAIDNLLFQSKFWKNLPELDDIHVVTTKNAYMIEAAEGQLCFDAWPRCVNGNAPNPWAGDSLAEVEAFCLDLARYAPKNYNPGLFMVLDTIGLEVQNVIICQRAFEEVYGDIVMKDNFVKMRMPWDEDSVDKRLGPIAFEEVEEKKEDRV